jgi:hypothetical protein
MTIAVGVLATRGVVLVADTQLTYGTFAKSQGGKIMAVTRRRSGAFALTGATDRIGYLSAVGETLADDFMAGPSGFSVGERTEMCHERATASRASRATRGAFGAPGPRGALAA